jgi:acyl-coenzyme A synthetase/AMP-(fatty) acid ligase
MLAGANRVDSIVVYLAALAAGHPLLLVPGDNQASFDSLLAAYDPDVVVTAAGDGQWRLEERRAISVHVLHPDLALLLSTSGSTGSPKLVRLSHENLQANAESIAAYLGIRTTDRAATTLPMHYCYGLSVINSHLLHGAALILTELSVADSCFWELLRQQRGTTFAGVPYTFDLLDRVGFGQMSLPSLRYVTQAGGRLAPERVRAYAELGQRNGWDLFVMYGQTEATARMAYLPPDRAIESPHAIGVPIPGGSFRLEPLPEGETLPDGQTLPHGDATGDAAGADVGELVYRGSNVMLGYAETPADLGLGRTVAELHTGDIARRGDGGLYEVIGRRSRFVKVFGLRIDLQRVEALLHDHGMVACCAGTDGELMVAVEGDGAAAGVQRLIADEYGLPSRSAKVCFVARLPRLASGKPDYPAVRALADQTQPTKPAGRDTAARADLRAVFADVLERSDVTDDSTFVSLGGDSLSYVEMSIRLEQALGHLPAGWHTTSIRDLRAAKRDDDQARTAPERSARRRFRSARRLDTTVALRAIAIVLIVGSHIQVFDLPGGAHVLIGVAGFNFARFHLTSAERRDRVRHLARSISRIMLASMSWIAAMYVLTDDYNLASVFLAHYLVGPEDPNAYGWHFWFVEALAYFLLILLAAVSLPVVDRLERRLPFALPLALAALGLISRYQLVPGVQLPTPVVVFWLFALGWATAKAGTRRQRLFVTVAIIATVPGFFGDAGREAVIVIGLMLMVWVADVPSLRLLNRVAGALAASSMYIYITHWQVFRPIDDHSRLLALLASLAFGVAYAMVVPRAAAKVSAVVRRWTTDRRTALVE